MKPAETSRMRELFSASGIRLDERQTALFARFYDLIERYNDELDLSRLKRSRTSSSSTSWTARSSPRSPTSRRRWWT